MAAPLAILIHLALRWRERLATRTIRCAVGCRDKWAAARFRGPLVRSAPLRSRPNSVACGRCASHTHELILRPVRGGQDANSRLHLTLTRTISPGRPAVPCGPVRDAHRRVRRDRHRHRPSRRWRDPWPLPAAVGGPYAAQPVADG